MYDVFNYNDVLLGRSDSPRCKILALHASRRECGTRNCKWPSCREPDGLLYSQRPVRMCSGITQQLLCMLISY